MRLEAERESVVPVNWLIHYRLVKIWSSHFFLWVLCILPSYYLSLWMSKNSKRVVSVYAVFSKPVVSAMNSYPCISLYELTCVLKFIYSIRVSIILDCILYWSLNWCTCSCQCLLALFPAPTYIAFCCLQYGKLGGWACMGMRLSVGTFWLYMNLFCKGFWVSGWLW